MTSDDESIRMARAPPWLWPLAFVAYMAAAALGLLLAFPGTNASPFWPPTALALALLYRYGLRLWPAILAGAFTINLIFMLRAGVATELAVPASIGVGIGNALEAWIGIYLLRRYAGKRSPFDSLRGLFAFVMFSATLAPMASATIGVTVSRWVSLSGTSSYSENWLTWWVGDTSGALTMAPMLMLLLQAHWQLPPRSRLLEAIALFLVLVLGTMIVFGVGFDHNEHRYPLVFFLLPMILWAVLRFHAAGAVTAVFLISLIAVIGSLHGGGPFARDNVQETLILLQLFMIVLAGTALGLGAVLAERRRMAQKLARTNAELHALAFNDPLTGLPNRRTLIDRLEQARHLALRHQKRAALLFLDLDKFKRINDSLGHEVGDALLVTMAERLRSVIRVVDSVCRLGGDEFVVLLSEIDGAEDATLVARKIIEALQAPVRLAGLDLAITASIGIALIPDDGTDSDDLIRYADLAMYRAKEHGRNNFQFYTEELNQSAVVRLEREHELRQALLDHQFRLHYQPIVDLQSTQIIGIEALLRWQHPKLGLLLPSEFMALAEETGLIVDIGAWVLKQACTETKRLHESGQRALRLSVNLSLRQLHDRGLPELIDGALQESQLDALWLNLEITERLLHEKLLAELRFLHHIDRIGVSLTVDNFGSAGSSLSLLKQLPIAVIKIDHRLVDRLPEDRVAHDISLAMIAMAHQLGISVIAENVETRAQDEFLVTNGCDYAQGIWFYPPMPMLELTALFKGSPATGRQAML
jgi:diguanylate cyclase (GGDEF)-like protein